VAVVEPCPEPASRPPTQGRAVAGGGPEDEDDEAKKKRKKREKKARKLQQDGAAAASGPLGYELRDERLRLLRQRDRLLHKLDLPKNAFEAELMTVRIPATEFEAQAEIRRWSSTFLLCEPNTLLLGVEY
jgi:hypothetical protein